MEEPKKYLAFCLDPVHVGTGGYRLGLVDMSIVREPATGIPKVPGTSLAGVIRAYAEQAKEDDESLPEIDVVFGTAEGEQGRQGMVRFHDMQIFLFPVNSLHGTVWVSTAYRLIDWVNIKGPMDENKAIPLVGFNNKKLLQLGWLLLETEEVSASLPLPSNLSFVKKVAIVSDKLFYHLVNDHLEVRTSVKISRDTGAAEEGALFTYEAIPRGTILRFEVTIDRRRGTDIKDVEVNRLLQKAFIGLKILGIGGMGTRGFGRVEILNE